MKTLIWREFNMMAPSWKGLIKIFTLLSSFLLFFGWVLGPRIFNILEISSSNLYICIVIFIITQQFAWRNLKQDSTTSQQKFLHILPIKKSEIVHAKFLSFLLLYLVGLISSFILVFTNIWLNHEGWSSISTALLIPSMFIFITSITLYKSMFLDDESFNVIYYISLAVWTVIILSVIYITKPLNFSMFHLTSIFLIFSLAIYLLFWFVTIQSLRKRGFKQT